MLQTSWLFWALMSAVFAAMTAVLTKLGVANINSDLATFIRTCVILVLVGLIAYATKQFSAIGEISTKGMVFLVVGLSNRRIMAVLLSRYVIGASFSSCTYRQAECGVSCDLQCGFAGREAQYG